MSFIGESALSSLFHSLLDKIECPEIVRFAREGQVLADLRKWENMLMKIQAVLEDAEEKQMSNRWVKRWLDDLKDLAYHVEDILDDFQTYSLQRQLKGETEAGSSKFRKLSHSVTTTINPGAIMLMKFITTRFQEIVDQQNGLDLMKKSVGGTSYIKVCARQPSTCLEREPRVYGRDEDKRKILDLISRNEASDVKVGVIPIVGMGGVGKTTLARLVYNDESLQQQQFCPKAWVCVSDDFDILRISKSILESITLKSCDLKELNQVHLKLQEELEGKKFLIVLDDVWNKNYDKWITLCSPLMHGAPGSRVIVTTRDEAIARMMKTIQSHNLNCISNEDCWSLFLDHAFASRSVADADIKLKVIREKVITYCDGLPLAARTLGGLLRSEPREDWENVMNCKIWNLQGDGNNILPVLRLSYYHLPSHLKRCFAYCAIFPKDYVFQKKQLVLLWMAEGLIEQRDDMEDVGEEYFQDLCSRSLFQSSSNGGFMMHDLVNDVAKVVAGDTCFRLEDELTASNKEKARHSSYIPGLYDRCERFEPFERIKHMRTFLPLSLYDEYMRFYLAKCVPSYLLSKLRCLRVLSFNGYNITELPDSIGDLKHLRYLDLSYTDIVTLPETTTSLCNLQTLLLNGCYRLNKLPSEMQNLIKLRHLDMENTYAGMPQGIEALKSLRILSDFVVGKGNEEVGITALMNLKFLQGALRISRLDNVSNASDVRGAILLDKEGIDYLVMEDGDRGVLEMMKPHGNLKNLTIWNYGGIQFPLWVGDPLFSNLVRLQLLNCKNCTTLPQLGLLSSLKDLLIEGFPNVKAIDMNSNPFPALETLTFNYMEEWEEWNIRGCEFSHLRKLSIDRCPKLLGKLPSHLPSLQELYIRECLQLVVSFESLPVISNLNINGCKKVELRGGFSFPNILFVHNTEFLFQLKELMQGLRKLECLTIGPDSSVIETLRSPHWTLFWDDAEKLLQKGVVTDSECKIVKFQGCCPENLLPWLHSFKSLRKVFIANCSRLVSLPDAVIYSSLCLEELRIESCHSLISIGRHQLPPTLIRLEIIRCNKLQMLLNAGEACSSSRVENEESMSCHASLSNLQYLKIIGCDSLIFLGQLPASLKDLVIDSFRPARKGSLAKSNHLPKFSIPSTATKIIEATSSSIDLSLLDCSFTTKGRFETSKELLNTGSLTLSPSASPTGFCLCYWDCRVGYMFEAWK
ncbi:putative disease resistance RPP13-like protein 1 [Hevea brasiliensis]|uniref:putative disease resistance RPP13-like protein 1 n=1 Tax=Hevea brasiliensis TaxID=3981 RepID=UPI0025DA41EB|nr:putative disease resistance RPP13-like protein 1 [Hevea brasiliensis]